MEKTKITEETIKEILFKNHGWFDYSTDWEKDLGLIMYASPCKRYVLMPEQDSNIALDGDGWGLHIDNSDMSSIGGVSVVYIEQVLALVEIYKDF
jgi:hypothetical protein